MKPPWLEWAEGELGQAEVPGPKSNARIVAYRGLAKISDSAELEDSLYPWCAAFVGAALEETGIQGTHSGLARSYSRTPLLFQPLHGSALGAIVVWWRGSRTSGLGHVAFYVGEDATHIAALGGNQGDSVKIALFPKKGATMGILGQYWPCRLNLPAIASCPVPTNATEVSTT